jgi:hypothetical protein
MGASGGTGRRIGRAMEIIFPILASVVFVVLWIYVAVAVFGDETLLEDTWAWLTGLDLIPAVIVWIAILPIGVFLWAWGADLEPILMGLVMVGMVAWTGLAFSGLRNLRRSR